MLSRIKNKQSIVIIDESSDDVLTLTSLLGCYGLCNIIAFSNSRDALDWLLLNPWDLVLLNLSELAPNGMEILELLKVRNRTEFPIIVSTEIDDTKARHRGLKKGANDFISKPFNPLKVMPKIRGCLELARSAKTLRRNKDEFVRRIEQCTAQLESSYNANIRTLCRAACYRDDDTGNHVRRIGDSAYLLACSIGMSLSWCEMIRIAAPMHDVGKIGIEDAILQKTGALTTAEREKMQEHSRIGYQILNDPNGSAVTQLAAEIALRHHERWDGKGYPDGLQGEEIPLSARIVAVCDVYDALRMARPYKGAWSVEQSKNYLIEEAGKHFDSLLVVAFCNLIDEVEKMRS
ncbi:HD-GYP domain-containing protein [Pseudomonas sp. FP2309]|uniref:HD-GYP domain-containing protein n=1 Tax=Pseudomonas sp. FP2309 TaxID=2954091 RepID=UPI00273258D4|nr:HD domain-containing phosphohydrolase [Pseudomonas sp. FP2309]WLH70044.1 HD domain-containing protein [Pseudomonas sp. FP2309]